MMVVKPVPGEESFYFREEWKLLPDLLKLDDYRECIDNANVYCAIDAKLGTINTNSEIWNILEEIAKDMNMFDRSVLHRYLCIPLEVSGSETSIKRYSDSIIGKEIKNLSLTASSEIIACTDGITTASYYDYIIWAFFIIYINAILIATILDVTSKIRENSFLAKFSLRYNWRDLLKTNRNQDYVRLKCIQGIRFLNILLIIELHIKLMYVFVYPKNPEHSEQLIRIPILQMSAYLDCFLVQTFFMISSWLLVIKIHNIYEKHGFFSFKHMCIVVLNRYFRLAVSLTVAVVATKSLSASHIMSPTFLVQDDARKHACDKNWLATILFYNNIFYFKDICHVTSWYVSADFQMFTLIALTFYCIFKYKLNNKYVWITLYLTSHIFYGCIILYFDLDVIYRPHIRNFEIMTFSTSLPLLILYQSTLSNIFTSYIGVLLGTTYISRKTMIRARESIAIKLLCLTAFFLLPFVAVLMSTIEYSSIWTAVIGPILKPLFALGIGAGILGMSLNYGGIIKKILESRFLEIMGNITYCTYIFHLFILYWFLGSDRPVEMNNTKVVVDYIVISGLSTILGLLATLVFELPGQHMQKLLLPQIPRNAPSKEK